jgi:hypothetical protein
MNTRNGKKGKTDINVETNITNIDLKELAILIQDTVENVLLKKIPPKQKRQINDEMNKLIPIVEKYQRETHELLRNHDKAGLARLSEGMLTESNEVLGGLNKLDMGSKNALDTIKDRFFEVPEAQVEYIKRSKYYEYRACVKKMVGDAKEKGWKCLSQYLETMDDQDSDILAWAQSLNVNVGEAIRYLTPERKQYTQKMAITCIGLYQKMSGLYELLIKMIAGLVSIDNRKTTDYTQFKGQTLGKNLTIIESKGYGAITKEFDKLIRNAVAHNSYQINFEKRQLVFSDRSGEKCVSYKEMYYLSRTLSCLILALSLVRAELNSILISEFSDMLIKQ